MSDECRSSWYADTGRRQERGEREVRCGLESGHDGDHAETFVGEVLHTWRRPTAILHMGPPGFTAPIHALEDAECESLAAARAEGFDLAVAALRDARYLDVATPADAIAYLEHLAAHPDHNGG